MNHNVLMDSSQSFLSFQLFLRFSLFYFSSSGTPPSTEVRAGPYPFMVTSLDGRQVPVVQAYAYGKYLGKLKVTFDENGNVIRSSGNPILLDSSIQQGMKISAWILYYAFYLIKIMYFYFFVGFFWVYIFIFFGRANCVLECEEFPFPPLFWKVNFLSVMTFFGQEMCQIFAEFKL